MAPIRRALRAITSTFREIDRGFSVFYGSDGGDRSKRSTQSDEER